MSKIKRLTPGLLRKIVLEEKSKIEKVLSEKSSTKVKAKEVDADKLADSLEKKVDYAKLLKLKEEKVRGQLDRIVAVRRALAKKILGDL